MDTFLADTILYLRAIQGHSGGKHINPTCQHSVLLPDDFAEHIYHVGNSHDMHSIIQSGLTPGGRDVKQGRHAVFLTAVNPMFIDRDTALKCSVRNQLENTTKIQYIGVI